MISFQYRGARCREQFKLPSTAANLKWAANRKALIEDEIARGQFDYGKHFPNSKHARRLSLTPAKTVTVGELLIEWLNHVRPQLQPETYGDYAEYCRTTWAPRFGSTNLADFTLADVACWISEQNSSKKRILNLLTPLRQACRYAVSPAKLLVADPIAGVKVRRPTALRKDVIDPFTKKEIDAALPRLEPAVANLVEFWAWTGLREGELFALRWGDVDLDRGVISVDKASRAGRLKATKTRAGVREVKLLAPALAALARQKPLTRLLHKEIFLSPTTGEAWGHDKPLRNRWHAALEAAGVRYRFPRQLRHTYASWMLNAGESPLWVSRQMGHADLAVTLKVYTRFVADMNTNAGELAVRLLK
jgi:integrase